MVNNEQAIREAAYYIWQKAGCPSGQDEYFWSKAVEQLSKSCSKTSCSKKSTATKTSASSKKSSNKKSK